MGFAALRIELDLTGHSGGVHRLSVCLSAQHNTCATATNGTVHLVVATRSCDVPAPCIRCVALVAFRWLRKARKLGTALFCSGRIGPRGLIACFFRCGAHLLGLSFIVLLTALRCAYQLRFWACLDLSGKRREGFGATGTRVSVVIYCYLLMAGTCCTIAGPPGRGRGVGYKGMVGCLLR